MGSLIPVRSGVTTIELTAGGLKDDVGGLGSIGNQPGLEGKPFPEAESWT